MPHPRVSVLVALSLASACDTISGVDDSGIGGSSSDYTTWTGTETYRYGYGTSIDDYACELQYTAAGVPAAVPCAQCTFAFEVTFTYDADSSVDDGNSCTGYAVDRTEIYAYHPDYNGYGGYIGTRFEGAFYPLGPATFDEDSSTFSYTYGETDPYSGYSYYTDAFSGTAVVE